MLIHNRKRQRRRQALTKTGFVRILFFILMLFNIGTVAYTRSIAKSAGNPVLEAKAIDEMVIYHFVGSLVLGGGLCLIALASEEEK